MRYKGKKLLTTLLVWCVIAQTFLMLIHFPQSVYAADVPDVWLDDTSVVTGLTDVGDHAAPTLRFNVTGDGNWTLISGDKLGNFHGFYWNGAQWIADDARIAGLGNIGGGTAGASNYSKPYVAYDVTGDGNWTLICGRDNGDFRGFYWAGSQWVEKSSYVQGLGDIGQQSAPSMAFNVTGDGNWTLISGEYNAGHSNSPFYAFYWNGAQWVSDASRKTDLRGDTDEHAFTPDLAYNVRGDDKWCLISGGYYYPTYGFEWNGSQWNFYGLVVANAIWAFGADANDALAFVYNLTGSDKWSLIGGGHDGNFYGLTIGTPTTANQIVELGRGLLGPGQDYVYGFTYSGGYLYGGTQTTPSQVIKFSVGTMEPIANFTLTDDDGYTIESCAIVVGDYLYLGNNNASSRARIVKVDLTTFTKVSTLMLDAGDTAVWHLASDGTYLYAVCSTARLVRIDLSDFTRKDHLTLSATAYSLQYENGYLYAGISSGLVQKVDVSTFTIEDTLDVDAGMAYPIDCLASKGDGWLYAGYTDGNPNGHIRKVNLTTFSNDAGLDVGYPIYVDHMVIVGDNLFFLDSVILREVYLPSFSIGTYRSFIETSYDLATDGFYVYVAASMGPAEFEKFYFTGAVLHSIRVTSDPSISVRFTIDGSIYWTPYLSNVPEGPHTLQVIDVFPKSGAFQLVYKDWKVDGVPNAGDAYTAIYPTITVDTNLTIEYDVGVMNLRFEDDFETGDLSKQDGAATWPSGSSINATPASKYSGSYGLEGNAYMGMYGGYAWAYKTNTYQPYVYLNFMLYVPSDVATKGWFALLRDGLGLNPTATGYADPPKYTQWSLGWHSGHFEMAYWRGDLEYLNNIGSFQFDKWYNITMFIKTSSSGMYALWIDGQLAWYRFHDDTSLWGASRSYLGTWAYAGLGNYISTYTDEEKIYSFEDPDWVTVSVSSTPIDPVEFTINGDKYLTNVSLLEIPATYSFSVPNMTITINDTDYAFMGWKVNGIEYPTQLLSLQVTGDTDILIEYVEAGFPPYKPPGPSPKPPPCAENFYLFIFAAIMLICIWAVSEIYKTQWLILFPGVTILAYALWVVLNGIECNTHWRWMIPICIVAILYGLYRLRRR